MPFFNDNEGEIISILFKGLNKLIQITLQIWKKELKIREFLQFMKKKNIEKNLEEIKPNTENEKKNYNIDKNNNYELNILNFIAFMSQFYK